MSHRIHDSFSLPLSRMDSISSLPNLGYSDISNLDLENVLTPSSPSIERSNRVVRQLVHPPTTAHTDRRRLKESVSKQRLSQPNRAASITPSVI